MDRRDLESRAEHRSIQPPDFFCDPLAKGGRRFQVSPVTAEETLQPILITDDESEDRFFLQKALRRAGVKNPIVEFRDGADLLEFLERETAGRKSRREIASLLFLDIKMLDSRKPGPEAPPDRDCFEFEPAARSGAGVPAGSSPLSGKISHGGRARQGRRRMRERTIAGRSRN
jgi:CheY-like chemotaxis protein